MQNALTAITDELRRLKAAGVKSVSVSEDSLALLRKLKAQRPISGPAAPTMAPRATDSEPPKQPVPVAAIAVRSAPIPETKVESRIPAPVPFALPAGTKSEQMTALRETVLNDPVCRANVRSGKLVVVGVGNLDAKIMFVGEAPGAEEEMQGEPFVGPAGQLLTKMIGAMGLTRGDVYIGNIMNWRPQLETNASGVQFGNRPPTAEEMSYCLPYLKAQIEIVNPEVLVALGTTAAQGLLGQGSFKALGDVRGQWSEFGGKPLMVTYHPSYILRNQSNRSKRMIWDDLLKVMERTDLPISARQRAYFLDK
jgi:DNA polymerase